MTAITESGNRNRKRLTGTSQIERRAEFDRIYAEHHHRIYHFAWRMMGNPDDAFDLTQDAFISAFQHLEHTDGDLNVSAWLHRITMNKCIDALRRRKRLSWLPWDSTQHSEPVHGSGLGEPERTLIDSEIVDEIQHVLNEMTPRYRMALLLREYQGLSIAEISICMGRTESSIKSLLHRSREQFRELYQLHDALAQSGQSPS